MPRVFIQVDETNPNAPVPELHVNQQVLKMTYRELDALAEEIKWAQGAISGIRAAHWNLLKEAYKCAD